MERCKYELFVEEYFGLKAEDTADYTQINTNYGQLVNLLAAFDQKYQKQVPILSWQCRYSNNEKSDKRGRWSRLCFYRGFLIAWISREHIDYGTFFTIKDFFPTNGNSDPCFSGIELDFEKAKEEVEKRFKKFLQTCVEVL